MKKIFCIIIVFFSFFACITNTYAEEFELYSEKALLYNLNDNEVLYEKNSDIKTSIASLTKITTAIVAIEKIKDFDETITITDDDLKGLFEKNASTAGFKVGDEATYEELLYGLLLPSGADAANALARNISGSQKKFVEEMNKFATKLNLKNTHYANPTGLDDEENYSTLEDVATVFKYAIKNKEFNKIITTMEYETKNTSIDLVSTVKRTIDKSDITMDYLKGGKTGTTDDAGLCLASLASYGGVDYMLITTNAPYVAPYNYHVMDAKKIYDYYINNYSYQPIIKKGDELLTLNTKYGDPPSITFKSTKTIKKYLKNDFNIKDIEKQYNGKEEISPLTQKGENLGKIKLVYNDKTLDIIDINLNEFIMVDLKSYFNDNKIKCFIIILTVSIITYIFMKIFGKKKKRKRKRK